MSTLFRHLILYDGYCALCHSMVRSILKRDKKQLFAFAPLQGQTARRVFKSLPKLYSQLDSVILIEYYQTEHQKVWIKAKASLRICALLGGWLHLLGWMAHLPSFLVNPFYSLFAKRRFQLFGTKSSLLPDPSHKDRFLE